MQDIWTAGTEWDEDQDKMAEIAIINSTVIRNHDSL
mgnify:CR=1 FL=1